MELVSRCLLLGSSPDKSVYEAQEKPIAFRSQGATLRGYLILPQNSGGIFGRPPPVIVFSHGFSTTQHMGLVDTAKAISSRTGCAAVTFDHSGFGESDGPRLRFSYWTQTCGYLDLVTYLVQNESQHVDVDRIALWGESGSSRDAIVAGAVEPRVRAIIAVTPPCGRGTIAGAEAPAEAEAPQVTSAGLPLDSLNHQLMDDESVFEQMKAQLTKMRTRVSNVDDDSEGDSGGAWTPSVAVAHSLLVIPDVHVQKSSNPENLKPLNVVQHTPGNCSPIDARPGDVWMSADAPRLPGDAIVAMWAGDGDAAVKVTSKVVDGSNFGVAANRSSNVNGGAAALQSDPASGSGSMSVVAETSAGAQGVAANRQLRFKTRRPSVWIREEQRCKVRGKMHVTLLPLAS